MDAVHGSQTGSPLNGAVGGNVDSEIPPLNYDGGSFRDRTARVFTRRGEVFRLLTGDGRGHWQRIQREPFFQDLSSNGRIVRTHELATEELASFGIPDSSATVLHHDRIPFISYPYEWPFSMLRAAALLHLEILLRAVRVGMILKDSSPYNVQFRGSRPVFIDIGSFMEQPAGEPWTGYRQFCEMMLFPMLLQSYKQIDLQPILRANLDGISARQFIRSLSWRDMVRPGVLTHGWLQSLLGNQNDGDSSSTVGDLKSSGFTTRLIENNLVRLTSLVKHLKWIPERTVWTNYRQALPHVVADLQAKSEFVEKVASSRHRKLVWDLGCNDGHFSKIAGRYADTVVAMDQDHGCVERLYGELAADGCSNILPLRMDLLNPSPAMGWRGRERVRLEQRGLPELTICLGLIHHLVIAGNIPLREVADWLSSLNSEVVLEFPSKHDPMVRQLLKNKRDQYQDYSLVGLEDAIKNCFRIRQRMQLPSGERTLLHLAPISCENGVV